MTNDHHHRQPGTERGTEREAEAEREVETEKDRQRHSESRDRERGRDRDKDRDREMQMRLPLWKYAWLLKSMLPTVVGSTIFIYASHNL